ncbi:hypothetical protein N6B72_12815 [Chryseobacterium soli]|uniref:hypothetical protein n=1 Tax=Chryseobacterium soli TaxID=445961 RepID=UPI0029551F58|nr:hypothetical protein [Chryseobacterium soli]MDV7697805.1 hypothetical protein [Chryseobacterium soli]
MKKTQFPSIQSISKWLKRSLLTLVILFPATFMELYWSMGQLSDHTSSSCLECSFFEDAFLIALMTGIFLTLLFSLLSLIKNLFIKAATSFIIIASVWFFWNYTLFVERESSWSTYLFREELYITAYLSFLPVIILSCVSIFLLYFREIKTTFVKTTI